MNNDKHENLLNINHILDQESLCLRQTEEFWGKNRNGFCDNALIGIEVLMQGVGYYRNVDYFNNDESGNDFNHAIRTLSIFHYYRIGYTFRATYNLLLKGYYTEASILLRSVVETFVRLKFINKEQNIELVYLALAGHKGYMGKKFSVKYETQFDKVAPGLYKFYRLLCDISHGAIASHIMKSNLTEKELVFDTGLVFKAHKSSFVINQFGAYILSHIEFMIYLFPEIKFNMPDEYAEKMHKVLSHLWGFLKEMSQKEKNQDYYNAIKKLVSN